MNERGSMRGYLVAAWVVVSGVVGYACLGYAVFRAHGDALRGLVNQAFGLGV